MIISYQLTFSLQTVPASQILQIQNNTTHDKSSELVDKIQKSHQQSDQEHQNILLGHLFSSKLLNTLCMGSQNQYYYDGGILYSIMSKNQTNKISNGYSKYKHSKHYEGYRSINYTNPNLKSTLPLFIIQKQDENFLKLKKKVELSLEGNRIFKLYSRLSQSITQSIQNFNILKKVREIQCQLLKLILINPTIEEQQSNDKRMLKTQSSSNENWINKQPNRNLGTAIVKRRRAFQQSLVQSSSANFQKFRISESLKRLQLQLQRIPQNLGQSPLQDIKNDNKMLQNEIQQHKFSQKYLSEQLRLKNVRLSSLVSQVQELQILLESAQTQITTLKNSNSIIFQQLKIYKDGVQYKQLWRMASQQINSLTLAKKELQIERKLANRKYKTTKDRLNQLMRNRPSGHMDETKQDMDDLKYLIAELNQTFKAGNNLQQFAKPIYKLPNVLVLFQEEKIKQSDADTQKMKILGTDFFLRLRAIMDGKYNQFWSNTQTKNCINLADFAMGFMDKFTIDPKYKKIILNGSNIQQIQKNKLQLILDLSSSKLKDVVEILLFKQFLFEERSKDELFFYLSCRHVLFNGHVLDNFICSQDPILFIPLDRAFKVIDQILINFDKNLTDRIKQALNLKRKKKAHKFFVDGHFLLKALLQLYSLERKKKLSIFKKSLQNQDPRKKSVTFKVLKKFLNKNYPFVTNSQITQLYRNCWKLTHGQFQIQTLFNMCDWIFVQQLKDQIFLPKRFNNQYKQIMERANSHLQEGKYFTRRILQLGNEKLLVYSNRLKQFLAMKSRDCLNVEHLFGLMSMLELPKTIKMMQILATSSSNKIADFRLFEFEDVTTINMKNEDQRRKLKQAAQKIGVYFDKRIKTLYKRFGQDINKQLAGLEMNVIQ